MCGHSTTNTNQVTGPADKWVQDAAKQAYTRMADFSKTPAPTYTGQRTAGLTPLQTSALSGMSKFASLGTGTNIPGAPGSTMNPYVRATLDPQIQRINEQAQVKQQQLAGSSMAAGAYGDARQGVLERGLNQDTSRAITDATGNAYKDAFDKYVADQQLGMSASQLQLQGGAVQQQTQQNALDAAYKDWLMKQQDPYNKFNLLISAMSGTPYAMQTSGSTTTPDNSGLSLLGGLLGGMRF